MLIYEVVINLKQNVYLQLLLIALIQNKFYSVSRWKSQYHNCLVLTFAIHNKDSLRSPNSTKFPRHKGKFS